MPPARPRTAAQDGFTLVELLIAATLMGLILTASFAVLRAIEGGQREVTSRADELTQAATAAERMTRELRQATAVLVPVPATVTTEAVTNSVQVRTYVFSTGAGKAVPTDVTYTCGTQACTRTAGGVTRTVMRSVVNPNVFTVRKNDGAVNYVSFDITVNSQGRTITLRDGVDMRNL